MFNIDIKAMYQTLNESKFGKKFNDASESLMNFMIVDRYKAVMDMTKANKINFALYGASYFFIFSLTNNIPLVQPLVRFFLYPLTWCRITTPIRGVIMAFVAPEMFSVLSSVWLVGTVTKSYDVISSSVGGLYSMFSGFVSSKLNKEYVDKINNAKEQFTSSSTNAADAIKGSKITALATTALVAHFASYLMGYWRQSLDCTLMRFAILFLALPQVIKNLEAIDNFYQKFYSSATDFVLGSEKIIPESVRNNATVNKATTFASGALHAFTGLNAENAPTNLETLTEKTIPTVAFNMSTFTVQAAYQACKYLASFKQPETSVVA